MKPDKIAFRLDTPEAVEYANGHRENKKEYYVDDSDGFYFHVPSSHRSAFGPLHILDHIAPGYTDVTPNFLEDYHRPWIDRIKKEAKERAAHTMTLKDVGGTNEPLYTHYQLDLINMSEEWDTTICDSLKGVYDTLKYLDIHLDDDTPTADGKPRQVVITGIPMTRAAFKSWKRENLID
jgi:hypothetical protein